MNKSFPQDKWLDKYVEAREALKPFAKMYEWFNVGSPLSDDTETVYDCPDGTVITVGDLRKAYKLVKEK